MKDLKRYLVPLARISLGLVFVYAALVKVADPVAFAGSVAAYRLLPYFGNYVVAASLPFVELACGLLLATGYRARPAALVIAAMNVVFMVALASAIARGLDIDCGCFKQGGEKTSPWLALGRDAVFLAISFLVLKLDPKASRAAASGPDVAGQTPLRSGMVK